MRSSYIIHKIKSSDSDVFEVETHVEVFVKQYMKITDRIDNSSGGLLTLRC